MLRQINPDVLFRKKIQSPSKHNMIGWSLQIGFCVMFTVPLFTRSNAFYLFFVGALVLAEKILWKVLLDITLPYF